MSQKHERRRHEELARETASWQSWAVERWFTNGSMALMLDEPFRGPNMVLEFACLCSDGGRQMHQNTLDRPCVYVDCYEPDPKIGGALTRLFQKLLAPKGTAFVTIDRSVELESTEGILSYRARVDGVDDPRAWYAVQTRYIEAIERHARPERWAIVQTPYPPERPVPPTVFALRGMQGVGLITPMTCPGSAIEVAPPSEREQTP